MSYLIVIVISLVILMKTNSFFISYINKNKYHLLMSSKPKGFGITKKNENKMLENFKTTRATQFKHISGNYAKLLARECDKFDNIKELNDGKVIIDCYSRLENSDTCWFIGKIAHIVEISTDKAFQYYENLLIEYSKSLRPKELAYAKSSSNNIQLWYAPGNTEMNVAQNKQNLIQYINNNNQQSQNDTNINTSIDNYVGFQPEIYQSGEEGFRVKRDKDGKPLSSAFEVNISNDQTLINNNIIINNDPTLINNIKLT